MEGLLQADVDSYAVVERHRDSMPLAPTHAGMKGKTMVAMPGKMAAMKERMPEIPGKMKSAIKTLVCQKLSHGERARSCVAAKQCNASASSSNRTASKGSRRDRNDTRSSADGGSVPSMSSGEFQSKGCDRVAMREFGCPSCDATGFSTSLGTPRSVDDIHFKQPCHTCQGSCIVSAEVIKCMKCKGLGCLGSWDKGGIHFTSACTACNGRGDLAAVVRSSQDAGSKCGRNDLGWSLVAELKQLTNASDMENAAQRFASSGKNCSMAALIEAVDCSPHRSTQMAILKAVAPQVFGDQCLVIELSD